ncbi:MAG: hypothetical protein AAF533_16215 [Acidobacteriota bacterium]
MTDDSRHDEILNEPPAELDGARVLWWAWSGERPFGELPGAPDDERWIHGFAICRYSGSTTCYRFSCNSRWEVVQDATYDDEEQAKESLPAQYDRDRVTWNRVIDDGRESL